MGTAHREVPQNDVHPWPTPIRRRPQTDSPIPQLFQLFGPQRLVQCEGWKQLATRNYSQPSKRKDKQTMYDYLNVFLHMNLWTSIFCGDPSRHEKYPIVVELNFKNLLELVSPASYVISRDFSQFVQTAAAASYPRIVGSNCPTFQAMTTFTTLRGGRQNHAKSGSPVHNMKGMRPRAQKSNLRLVNVRKNRRDT